MLWNSRAGQASCVLLSSSDTQIGGEPFISLCHVRHGALEAPGLSVWWGTARVKPGCCEQPAHPHTLPRVDLAPGWCLGWGPALSWIPGPPPATFSPRQLHGTRAGATPERGAGQTQRGAAPAPILTPALCLSWTSSAVANFLWPLVILG